MAQSTQNVKGQVKPVQGPHMPARQGKAEFILRNGGTFHANKATDDKNFNTILTPNEEKTVEAWKKTYAPKDSGVDYDLRGAFKAGLKPDPVSGHWPDTFKKPNHPTFSDQSMYAKDAPDKAGSWNGDTYVPAKKKPLLSNDTIDLLSTQ